MLGVVQNERKGKQWEQWEQWEQGKKKTRGHGDARTRGAAGHTDLRTEISRVRGNLEPRVLVFASSPLRVSPEGTLRTWAPLHTNLLTPHSALPSEATLRVCCLS
ncbi:MAG: hypothetical protein BRC39_14950 [Cyanobacteria bacterium QH_7_48_89]|nr:MAG: hypothetical protein BRC39_14950 [Cyanobacteria bacterium QH_7_48_89]